MTVAPPLCSRSGSGTLTTASPPPDEDRLFERFLHKMYVTKPAETAKTPTTIPTTAPIDRDPLPPSLVLSVGKLEVAVSATVVRVVVVVVGMGAGVVAEIDRVVAALLIENWAE